MELHLTDTGVCPILDTYMKGFAKVFTLPDESEDREGFLACLALNHGAEHDRLVALHGEFREFVGLAVEDGLVVGGANFLVGRSHEAIVTVHLNYVHVDPAFRRRGMLRRIMDEVRKAALHTLPTEKVLMFIEQNDPLRMDEESYGCDTRASGIDQVDRLAAWSRIGARIVDFPYVQPELQAGGDANDSLVLAVIGDCGDTLPGDVLQDHLRRFFAVSVAKGGRLPASALRQIENLADGRPIGLIPMGAVVDMLKGLDRSSFPPGRLRDHARSLQASC